MRPIDAVALTEGIELYQQSTDQKYESDRQWAVGYNAGLDRALYSIAYAKTIAPPPNDPLTLEELRKMDGEPVWVTHRDGSGGRWGIVNIYPTGICADVCSGQAYWFEDYIGTIAYRRKPEGNIVRSADVCAATGGPCCKCKPGPCDSRKPGGD